VKSEIKIRIYFYFLRTPPEQALPTLAYFITVSYFIQ
jgi:hypothetical protein